VMLRSSRAAALLPSIIPTPRLRRTGGKQSPYPGPCVLDGHSAIARQIFLAGKNLQSGNNGDCK
jgi:hypothetical protein